MFASLLHAVDRGCQQFGPGRVEGLCLTRPRRSVWMMQAATATAEFVAALYVEAKLWHQHVL